MRTLAPPTILLLLSLLGASAPAHAQVCTGQAYFQPVEHEGIEFGHFTSTPEQAGGVYEQENCVVLVNDGLGAQSGVSGRFSFTASGGAAFTLTTGSPRVLAGSVATTCRTEPASPNGPQVWGVVEPATGTLAAGAFTDACCFVHAAQAPTDECESIPGAGDTFRVEVGAGGGPGGALTGTVPTMPQGPACGLVGLEALVALLPWAWRRRTRGAARVSWASLAAAGVLLSTGPARATMLEVDGGATSVELTLTAFTHRSEPVTLSQGLDVIVTIEEGAPTSISFVGGALRLSDTILSAQEPTGTTVSVSLQGITARLSASGLPVGPGGDFDVSGSEIAIEEGTLTGSGAVFAVGAEPDVDYANFPFVLTNLATTPGNVSVVPGPGISYDISVTVPVEFATPLSTDTGSVWLQTDNAVVGLTGRIAPTVPGLDERWVWPLYLALAALGVIAARASRRHLAAP